MTLTLNSVSSNSLSSPTAHAPSFREPTAHAPSFREPTAHAPSFREKDAVCIEARASKTTTTHRPMQRPMQSRSFQYQLADMQIAAQLVRYQGDAPVTYAHDVAFAYQQGRLAMIPVGNGIQV
jgi:hypothetical protein